MRLALLALVALVSSCKPANAVTPKGTVVFDWDLTRAGRATVRTAKIGPKTTKDFKVTIVEDDSPPLELDVHIEFAPIEFEEAGSMVSQVSPVAIHGTIANNGGWDIPRSGCDVTSGPNYQMGSIGADGKMKSPPGMIQDCNIRYHRVGGVLRQSSWQLGVTLVVNGDGNVKLFPPRGTVTSS
jgi:hypothetical protein